MKNRDIEILLKKEKIYKWEIAKKLGIHETTFIRWFRDELTAEQLQQIYNAISLIKAEKLEEFTHAKIEANEKLSQKRNKNAGR